LIARSSDGFDLVGVYISQPSLGLFHSFLDRKRFFLFLPRCKQMFLNITECSTMRR